MQKFIIKNRWTTSTIFECEAETLREACEKASAQKINLLGANLLGANLLGADLRDADLRDANLRDADLRHADLRHADLRDADLRDADLLGANLRHANLLDADLLGADLLDADLRDADLLDADLEPIRVDFFDILLRGSTNGEVPFLIAAIKEGRIKGSTYEGDCCCLVGTFANAKKCNYQHIPDLKPNSSRPAERFFLGIKKGDTPETNPISKIVLEWAEEFQYLMSRAKHQPDTVTEGN